MTEERAAAGVGRAEHLSAGVAPEPTLASAGIRRVPLAERMALYAVPGVSVAVINDYALDWARGYGRREAEQPERVTQGTLFQACSLSKPVAAAAALRLVQEGTLDLDEDVNRYLRSWQVPPNGGWQPRVTLRHILSHAGGFTVHGFPGYRQGSRVPDLRQILDGAPPANTPPIRVNTLPGAQYRYAGGGYTVLQQLLMDVTGEPFVDLMRRLVLAPLHMRDSTYEQPLPRARAKDAATGHSVGGAPVAGRWHVYPEQAAAGLWTTPSDMARFAVEIMNAYQDRPHALLEPATAGEMLTAQMGETGLGFSVGGEGESFFFFHGGDNVGYKCVVVGYPSVGKGAVVMTNSDEGWSVIPEVLRALALDYAWPRAGDGDWPPVPRIRIPIPVDPALYPAYQGVYPLSPRLGLTVRAEEGALILQATGQPPLPLLPLSETEYFIDAINAEVRFVRDDGGAVSALEFKQNGQTLRAEKRE